MTKLILTSPQDLTDQGFSVEAEPTLLDTPLYQEQRRIIDFWVDTIPEIAARPPWEYQRRYAAMGACRPFNLFGHEQGLGKTYETFLLILAKYGYALHGNLHKEMRRGAIQIIAPRHTLNLAWLKEAKTLGLDQFVDVILTEQDIRHSNKPIWLMHYDFLKEQTDHGKKLEKIGRHRVRITRQKGLERYFVGFPIWKLIRQKARPHMIIFDEVHNLREDSDRTEAMRQYVRGVKNRLALTGTPSDGWVNHLATILSVIYGTENRTFPWKPKAFTKRFTRERVIDIDYVTGESGGAAPKKRTAPGINPDQIPEFWRSTRHLMHRLIYRDPEVSGHVKFPPVRYHVEQIPMDFDHAEYYQNVHAQTVERMAAFVEALKKGSINERRLRDNVLTHLQMLRRAASCPWAVKDDILTYKPQPITKVTRTVEICLEMQRQGRKTIVFTNFIATGAVLVKALREAGLGAVRIYANDKCERPVDLPMEMREARIEDFLENPNLDVMVANLPLVSTGLTLVQASAIVNYDHDWRASMYKQGISRVVRPGQVWDHVDVWDLLTDRTSDLYVYNALMQKVKATAEMIDQQFSLTAMQKPNTGLVDIMAVAKALIAGDLQVA
jgi:SNF2 family DNA or RNA helicase